MQQQLSSLKSYVGVRATILGIGTFGGGVAAARFLAERGAIVTVTDMRSLDALGQTFSELQDLELHGIFLDGHPDEAFADCQLLVVNPAVKPNSPIPKRCAAAGAILTSEVELFLHHCPAQIIAITGSNGKSTTAALTHHILNETRTDSDKSVLLGGNIGISLLPVVEGITDEDIVILELSSFQLHYLRDSGFAPSIAVVTNLTPNHLDWHECFADYQTDKQILFNRQTSSDVAIVPGDHDVNLPHTNDMIRQPWRIRGTAFRFGISDTGEDGVFADDGTLVFRNGRNEDSIRFQQPSQLPGAHNLLNISATACAAWNAGADPVQICNNVQTFRPLPHRLQSVALKNGIRFYNDSEATTPESAIAALQTFTAPIVIIAGGSDKGADLTAFAEAIHRRTVAAVLIGQTAAGLAEVLRRQAKDRPGPDVVIASDFATAFEKAVALVPEGGIVLLSPGCASYGWFRDYRDRGDQFTKLARDWMCSQ